MATHAIHAAGVFCGFECADDGQATAFVGVIDFEDFLAAQCVSVEFVTRLFVVGTWSLLARYPLSANDTSFKNVGLAADLFVKLSPGGHAARQHQLVQAIKIAIGDGFGLFGGELFGQFFLAEVRVNQGCGQQKQKKQSGKAQNFGGNDTVAEF
jgi:hypothetical protein